jgi:hypothetical protein
VLFRSPVGSYQVPGIEGKRNPQMTGCHQPIETITGTEVPVAWFANGMRLLDLSNPHAIKEIGSWMPDPAPGETRACSNDIYQDSRGLIYLCDRVRGLSILERA